MYKVKNNITQEEYLLWGKALVQRDATSGSNMGSELIPVEYLHGVLLYSLREHLPVVVPYSIFEEEYYSEDADQDVPVWSILDDGQESIPISEELLSPLAEAEAQYHREWADNLRNVLPFHLNGVYKRADGLSDEESVQLLNLDYDTSFGTDDPIAMCAPLDSNGEISYPPVLVPTREFIKYYRQDLRYKHKKKG